MGRRTERRLEATYNVSYGVRGELGEDGQMHDEDNVSGMTEMAEEKGDE